MVERPWTSMCEHVVICDSSQHLDLRKHVKQNSYLEVSDLEVRQAAMCDRTHDSDNKRTKAHVVRQIISGSMAEDLSWINMERQTHDLNWEKTKLTDQRSSLIERNSH